MGTPAAAATSEGRTVTTGNSSLLRLQCAAPKLQPQTGPPDEVSPAQIARICHSHWPGPDDGPTAAVRGRHVVKTTSGKPVDISLLEDLF